MARKKNETKINEEIKVEKTTETNVEETKTDNSDDIKALLEQNKLLMERLAQLESANKPNLEESNEEETDQPKRLMRQSSKRAAEFKDKKRMIPIVCMVNHRVGYKCKTNNMFIVWDGQGDEHEISIEEAQFMFAESQEYLKNWLLADDDEFVSVMGLKDLYDIIFEIENIEKFYNQRMITIQRKLEEMPEGIRQELLNKTAVMINDGSLNTPNVLALIKLLRDTYNIELDV